MTSPHSKPDHMMRLYERYQAGESIPDLAQSIGVHRTTVHEWFRNAGLPLRGMRTFDVSDTRRLYERYVAGESIIDLAAERKVNRTTLTMWFKRMGLPTRPKIRRPTQTFNGRTYTPDGQDYYRATTVPRTKLHRDVWEHHYGPIPDGWDVHHKDGDKANNAIENLEAMPDAEHMALSTWKEVEPRTCLCCGGTIPWKNGMTPSVYHRRLYCGNACARSHAMGKPRGWSPLKEPI